MPFGFLSRHRKKTIPEDRPKPDPSLRVDVHAQLLPGRQDGTDSVEHSITLLREMAALGFRKVITTLHVMDGFYQNTCDSITAAATLLKYELHKAQVEIEVEAAAEYFLDINLLRMLYSKTDMLTFGNASGQRYLLFDTSLVKRPYELDKVIAAIQHRNLVPVMAHPEQYIYLQKNPEAVQLLHYQGVRLQVNLLSLTGNPSREARHLAEWMIDRRLVSFIGTDICHESQLPVVRQAQRLPYYRKALEMGLLNDSL